MSTAVTFTFVGPAAFARLLALRLTEEGLAPRYEPPAELRDDAGSLAMVQVAFTVGTNASAVGGVVEVVRNLATRYHGRFEIDDVQVQLGGPSGRRVP
ncbi:hypothetical protein [Microlunatus antarcticus]|uniref:DUF3240 domain-containing protein n=1 Tax=Microlunatus antarcticus TaxID=53388 RepID=A0A7W5JVU7_9ACTN|nr:hypothetical protein [Microlunatus antarcticus]MBB3326702.1 hypothetical protein [Microlunatus antarcticus]